MSQRRVPRDAAKEAWWREQVRAQSQSGLSVRAYCRQQQVSEPSFYAWRKELAKRDQERQAQERQPSAPTPPARATSVLAARATRPTFTEVILSSPAAVSSAAVSPIEIILAAGQRIVVVPGFDSPTLQAVLEVLERPRC